MGSQNDASSDKGANSKVILPKLPKRCLTPLILIVVFALYGNMRVNADIAIVTSKNATEIEQIAAGELRYYLSSLYRRERFTVLIDDAGIDAGPLIRIGTAVSTPELLKYLDGKKLKGSESYVVTHARIDGKETGIIIGADPAGVIYGVYGLLKKLGFGFYLTEDTFVTPSDKPFDLSDLGFENHSMVKDRIVFNWHNFLSGCTGWDYEQWAKWVVQSQKMGYNTVMVHAYGNNPMFTYSFNGIEKKVGYVATSRRGRDWGNQHVNDVRRLPGGWIFDGAEFGSEAALVPDEDRVEAKQAMMKKVFSLADKRGMKVCFALDVDTGTVIPQEMILTLDEKDRFHNGSLWLPRPDTKEGRQFYKAQVQALLKLYPQIDTVALWRRGNGQEWGRLKKSEQLPQVWQEEYKGHIEQNPGAEKIEQSVCAFALNKVVGAFRSELDDMGRRDVGLAMGSWNENWIESLVEFLPEEVTIMPLDWGSLERYSNGSFLRVPGKFKSVEVATGRVVPIIWAQHDDGEYFGRPLDCHKNFCDTLSKLQARGFGVIHWMNRPLDLYFVNHSNQVWSGTINEDLKQTCYDMAGHYFGKIEQEPLSECLYRWATEAPTFGRVTTDHFFYKNESIADPEQTLKKSQERLAKISLDQIDIYEMITDQRERFGYFRQIEKVISGICKVQELAYRPAMKALQESDYAKARKLLAGADLGNPIFWLAYMSQNGGGDRGEKAMVVSLGTRWVTDYLAACQAAGSEDIRINFGPTRFESLARNGGKYTYHVDLEGEYWSVRGERETKRTAVDYSTSRVVTPADTSESIKEVAQTGIVIDEPTNLQLSPMVNLHSKIAPGHYRLTVYAGSAAGEKQARVRFYTEKAQSEISSRVYVFSNVSKTDAKVYVIQGEVNLQEANIPELQIVPEKGMVILYGVKLEKVKNE